MYLYAQRQQLRTLISLENNNLGHRILFDSSSIRLVIPKGQLNRKDGHDFLKVYTNSINEK